MSGTVLTLTPAQRAALQRLLARVLDDDTAELAGLLLPVDDVLLAEVLATLEVTVERPDFHVLEVTESGWAIQHEALCFPDLLSCPVHRTQQALDEKGVAIPPPGRYRLTSSGTIAIGPDGYAVEVPS